MTYSEPLPDLDQGAGDIAAPAAAPAGDIAAPAAEPPSGEFDGNHALFAPDNWAQVKPGSPVRSLAGNWGIFAYSAGDKGLVIASWPAGHAPHLQPVKKLVPAGNWRVLLPLG